ncbi:unnamed protein product, partial [Didymodactylos carnosus]
VKFAEGAWVALIIALILFTFGFCWYYGQGKLRRYLHHHVKTTTLCRLPYRFGLTALSSNDSQLIPTTVDGKTTICINQHYPDSDTDSASSYDGYHDKRSTEDYSSLHGHVSLVTDVAITAVGNTVDFHNNAGITASITPGLGVFLTTSSTYTPHVFENLLKRLHAIPQVIIFLKISHVSVPILSDEKRLIIKSYGNQTIYHIVAHFGYCENKIHVLEILQLAASISGIPVPNEANITFFIPNATIVVNKKGWKTWFTRWPLIVYSVLKSSFPGPAKNLHLPPANTVSVGILAHL